MKFIQFRTTTKAAKTYASLKIVQLERMNGYGLILPLLLLIYARILMLSTMDHTNQSEITQSKWYPLICLRLQLRAHSICVLNKSIVNASEFSSNICILQDNKNVCFKLNWIYDVN